MKVRVTSIAWQEVGEMVRSVTTDMEKALNLVFQPLSFGAGITQLTIVVVAASAERDENERICKGYNKVGRVRHPFTGEQIRSIGLAIPFSSDSLPRMDGHELRYAVCCALLEKIAKPDLRIPREFNYEMFSQHLSGALARLSPR